MIPFVVRALARSFVVQASACVLLLTFTTSATEVRLKWRAVETDCIGYRLYWGPASGFYINWQDIPWLYQTNCTIELEPGNARHYLALAALGPAGESDLSPELIWQPPQVLLLIGERTFDGVFWQPAITNEIMAGQPLELWRLRIERKE